MMKIQAMDALNEAVKILKNDGVIIYPTDTLYGLGADATSLKAIRKIYKIKGRKFNKPLSISVSSIEQAEKYVKFDERSLKIAKRFFPGPLTIILPQKKEMKFISKDGKIAIRIPDNSFILNMIEKFGRPITSTSANIAGKKDPVKLSDIPVEVKEKCDLIIDGGVCKYRKPSTVVDIKLKKIIREGVITKKQLKHAGVA